VCGSLRLENDANRIFVHGNVDAEHIEGAVGDFVVPTYKWEGWARIDGRRDGQKTFKDQWPEGENRVVTITGVESFTERHRKTRENMVFPAADRHIAAIVNKRGELRILTRPARGEREVGIHPRMPVTVKAAEGRDFLIKYMNEKLGTEHK
jgi:hypothetical protein